jgi:hypothetical protein
VMVQLDIQSQGAAERAADKLDLVSKQTRTDLRKFKEFIEARGTETGGWREEVDRPQP